MSDTGSEFDQTCSPYEVLSETESNNGTGTPKTLSLSERLEIAREIKDSLDQSMERQAIEEALKDDPTEAVQRDTGFDPQQTVDEAIVEDADINEEKLNQQLTQIIETVNNEAVKIVESANQSAAMETVNNEINAAHTVSSPQPTDQSSPRTSGDDGQLVGITGFLARVAIKAKSSVDTMITTLDPGMKEFLYSGGDVNILVASDKANKIDPIRNAFIDVFGRATVKGIKSQSKSVAEQPTSATWAQLAAEERVFSIRENHTKDVPQNQVIVALENFLTELVPEQWFDIGCLYLEDPLAAIKLTTFTQATPVPAEAVNHLKFETASDYERSKSGFSRTIGSQMAERLNCSHESWHEVYSGVSRQSSIYLASVVLANLYKDRISSRYNPLTIL